MKIASDASNKKTRIERQRCLSLAHIAMGNDSGLGGRSSTAHDAGARLHQREAEEVQPSPQEGVLGVLVICREPDAPNAIPRARLHEHAFLGREKKLSQARVL